MIVNYPEATERPVSAARAAASEGVQTIEQSFKLAADAAPVTIWTTVYYRPRGDDDVDVLFVQPTHGMVGGLPPLFSKELTRLEAEQCRMLLARRLRTETAWRVELGESLDELSAACLADSAGQGCAQ